MVLRSGLVTREMIEKVAGFCTEYAYKEGVAARSPGMKYKYYDGAAIGKSRYFKNVCAPL